MSLRHIRCELVYELLSEISNTNFDTLNKPIQPENNNIENNKQNVILTGDVVVEEKEFTKNVSNKI